MEVKIINKSNNSLPEYSTTGSAGMDIRAFIKRPYQLNRGSRCIIHTGLYIEIPEGYEAQIRPRSGLAINRGITVINSPGTIDSDYRGEICVGLINLSEGDQIISPGERIAQIVFAKCEQVSLKEVDILSDTDRGEGGFGSTGIK